MEDHELSDIQREFIAKGATLTPQAKIQIYEDILSPLKIYKDLSFVHVRKVLEILGRLSSIDGAAGVDHVLDLLEVRIIHREALSQKQRRRKLILSNEV